MLVKKVLNDFLKTNARTGRVCSAGSSQDSQGSETGESSNNQFCFSLIFFFLSRIEMLIAGKIKVNLLNFLNLLMHPGADISLDDNRRKMSTNCKRQVLSDKRTEKC